MLSRNKAGDRTARHAQEERLPGEKTSRMRNKDVLYIEPIYRDDRLVFIKDTHNHPRDDSAIEAKKIVNHLKTTTQDNIRPVPQLYLEEIQKVAALPNADEVAANLPTFSAVKSALYRQRRKLIPALPSTRAEVTFEGEWARTASGKSFLLAEDGGEEKIVIC